MLDKETKCAGTRNKMADKETTCAGTRNKMADKETTFREQEQNSRLRDHVCTVQGPGNKLITGCWSRFCSLLYTLGMVRFKAVFCRTCGIYSRHSSLVKNPFFLNL